MKSAHTLGLELRFGREPFLPQRRAMAVLALVASGSMSLIALYQLGIIKHLPEPPLRGLDADRIDASDEAYSRLWTPDGVLGMGNYVATLGLCAMGGQNRAQEQPWIPLAMAAKVLFDAAQGIRLFFDQRTKYHALCFWCLLAAATTLVSIPLAIPEVWAALRSLYNTRSSSSY